MRKFLLFLLFLPAVILPQAGSYYDLINTSSASFVNDLKGRVRAPYTKVSYDLFDETNVANFASYANDEGGRSVNCALSGYEYSYTGKFTWGTMSREHTWCQSWMPAGGSGSDEYADQHHLFPSHQNNANGRRSNHPLGDVTTISYQFFEGILGKNSKGETVYEVRDGHKGDAARALLYMSVRYDGIAGDWSFNSLNSRLPGMDEAPQDVATLLRWHMEDPPDKWEVERNNYIQSIQKNRNPFVDRPEFVNYINFGTVTKLNPVYAVEPQNYVSNLSASGAGNSVTLSWSDAAAGTQAPLGYLITVYDSDNYYIPVDGAVYGDDTDLSDGRGTVNVAYSAADGYVFNGLSANTGYYFTVYSYNGEGSLINYKTDGTVPRSNSVTLPSTQTIVAFAQAGVTVSEGSGSYNLNLKIVNPDAANGVTLDVVLKSGDAADVGNYTTKSVTFPAGSGVNQVVPISITDDAIAEGNEAVTFAIENVSGGKDAAAGAPAEFDLTIEDNDATSVYFAAGGANVSEAAGVFELGVRISRASGSAATQAEVVLTSGSGTDINNYTTQVVTFPAGSSDEIRIPVTIIDDETVEGDEVIEFTLDNVSGGNNAQIAAPSVFTLTIMDNDNSASRVVISEVADHTTFSREYVEIFNSGAEAVNIENWILKERYGLTETFRSIKFINANQRNSGGTNYFILEPGEFAIIFRNPDDLSGFKSSYGIDNNTAIFSLSPYQSSTSVPQINGDEGYQLENEAGVVMDNFGKWDYSQGAGFRLAAQNSYQRLAGGNNSGEAAESWAAVPSGSYVFTPGADNDIPLPVELTSFTGSVSGSSVMLEWSTATEHNNAGFYVERSSGGVWIEAGFVRGAGTDGGRNSYYFSEVLSGSGEYRYRLRQTDLDGSFAYSGEVEVRVEVPAEFSLSQNYPNPFNPVTVIEYSIPEAAYVSIKIYSLLGEEVGRLVNMRQSAGSYRAEFDAAALNSGMYIYMLEAGGESVVRKMVLVK